MFYEDRIKPHLIERRGNRTLDRGENMRLMNEVVAERWALESEEIKESVLIRARDSKAEFLRVQQASELAAQELAEGSDYSPEDYLRCESSHFSPDHNSD
jgi:hypothetical protein